MNKEQIAFRCAFLKYLLNPSRTNQSLLYEKSLELSVYAAKQAQQKNRLPGADEANDELEPLIEKALQNIRISGVKNQCLESFLNDVTQRDKHSENLGPGSVLTKAQDLLKENLVTDVQYKVFSSIYEIEIDGYRLSNKHAKVSKDVLVLSQSLLKTTQQLFESEIDADQAAGAYQTAYKAIEDSGIENHRGVKEKLNNFLIALSCVLILPVFYHMNKANTTGSFWTSVKTKTQEHIDKCGYEIDNYYDNYY